MPVLRQHLAVLALPLVVGLLLAAGTGALPARLEAAPARASHCSPRETPLFTCRLRRATVSVCAGGGADGNIAVRYRHGRPGSPDLVYPAAGEAPLRLSRVPYSGGGEAQIAFDRGGYRYIVYSRMIRTRFDGGPNEPKFEAGVAVKQGDRLLADNRCVDPHDADIDTSTAEDLLPEGENEWW